MQAAEAKLQKVLEGSKQFLVPHYQRPYSWSAPQWQGLWTDILDLLADDDPQPHFLGSIVTAPARSVPEGVEKRLLIDGQQRLTTLVVLLALVRDRARNAGNPKLAEKLQDLVTNRHEEGVDRFKLLPTQGEDPEESDRDAFTKIVAASDNAVKIGISDAYRWFAARLDRPGAPDLDHLARVVAGKLTLVSIVLDDSDNPHRIFESLNGKGRPLSQADLIRNYFFMRLPVAQHESVYTELWRPMQRRLGEEHLTEFVRHYLMQAGQFVKEMDVYSFLKARVDHDGSRSPVDHLRELRKFADLYAQLLDPAKCAHPGLRERLARLARLEVTVAYPLLLGVLDDHASGVLDVERSCEVLDVLENFLIRRFVCGVPTHGLNKLLTPLYAQARKAPDFVAAVKKAISGSANAYPRDEQFRERLMTARLYAGGERREKTKYLLERLETALGHKEKVDLKPLTIEHVMPQTLTPWWQEALGAEWDTEHEELLHTLGNLTLTSYNAELGNASFPAKRAFYAASHVELNDYFATIEAWTAEAIEERAGSLAELALTVWPSFGAALPSVEEASTPAASVTGTTPRSLTVRGESRPVKSWVDVAVETVEAVIQGGEEEFARVAAELPKFVNHDATAFRRSSRLRRLSNGAYIETNLSAAHIHRLSLQVATLAGFSASEWAVDVDSEPQADELVEDVGPAQSAARQLQGELWIVVRPALIAGGVKGGIGAARPRYWMDITLGRRGIWLTLTANTVDDRIGLHLRLAEESATRLLPGLLLQREAIEAELGMTLDWVPYPEKKGKAIRATHHCDLSERDTWPEAVAWLVDGARKMQAAFLPRMDAIDRAAATPP